MNKTVLLRDRKRRTARAPRIFGRWQGGPQPLTWNWGPPRPWPGGPPGPWPGGPRTWTRRGPPDLDQGGCPPDLDQGGGPDLDQGGPCGQTEILKTLPSLKLRLRAVKFIQQLIILRLRNGTSFASKTSIKYSKIQNGSVCQLDMKWR